MVFHLDAVECVWYIVSHFMETNQLLLLPCDRLNAVLDKTYIFLKQYNNNYRPIYHLENILFFIMNQIHGYESTTVGV